MTKLEYMIYSLKTERYLERAWLLSCFGILPEKNHDDKISHETGIVTDGHHLTVHLDNGKKEIITDYEFDKPLYDRYEKIQIKAHTLKCIKEDIETIYGRLLMNALLIEYPYQGLVPYFNDEMTPKILNKIAYDVLQKDECTTAMHHRFENAVCMITVLSMVSVPCATRKTLTLNPEAEKLKKELLEKHKDELHDPSVVSDIQNQLMDLDKQYLKGDPSERFYISPKTLNSRLRTHAMVGAEQDFIDESKISVMTNSLSEGWGIKEIPAIANMIRGGSFNRGQSTALAGVEVKITGRIFQNYNINNEDCHTPRGLIIVIKSDNYDNYIGRYLLGKEEPIKPGELKHYIGKHVIIRSPTYCITQHTSFCKKCMGDIVSTSEVGINAQMTSITSTFTSIFLALVHTQALTTHRYNYLDRLT